MFQGDLVEQPLRVEMGLIAKVKQYLIAVIVPDGTMVRELVQMDSVCKVVGLLRRTFQRRLQEEGVTYLELLEEIRKQKSSYFIANGYSVNEITEFLGFKHRHCYIKAHQRWYDCTPSQYRKMLESLVTNSANDPHIADFS